MTHVHFVDRKLVVCCVYYIMKSTWKYITTGYSELFVEHPRENGILILDNLHSCAYSYTWWCSFLCTLGELRMIENTQPIPPALVMAKPGIFFSCVWMQWLFHFLIIIIIIFFHYYNCPPKYTFYVDELQQQSSSKEQGVPRIFFLLFIYIIFLFFCFVWYIGRHYNFIY